MNTPAALRLDARELGAVVALWRNQRRVLDTAFEGTSMLPAIAPGAAVRVECGIDPGVGEVAVFIFDGHVGVHRVVRRGTDWLLTWGDANTLPDAPISSAQLIGTIVAMPGRRPSWWRAALLAWIAPPRALLPAIARRVAFAHGVRRAWHRGPLAFAGQCLRRLARRAPMKVPS